MELYFRKDFKPELPYFKKTKVTTGCLFQALEGVCTWLGENGIVYRDNANYRYIVETTIGQLTNPNCDEGIFYYYWLNAYLREISYFVWRSVDGSYKAEGVSEKERSKFADNAMKAFDTRFKELFA